MNKVSTRIAGGLCPALKDGVLIWREGDVFDFYIKLRLRALGEEIDDLTGYSVAVSFFRRGKKIYDFSEEGGEDCTVCLSFTPEVSSLFRRGSYGYEVKVTSPDGKVTTVGSDCPAVVR